jgi:hypothetical protein
MVTGMEMDSGRPAGFPSSYGRGEIIADGVVHALGICSGLTGAVVIIAIVSQRRLKPNWRIRMPKSSKKRSP